MDNIFYGILIGTNGFRFCEQSYRYSVNKFVSIKCWDILRLNITEIGMRNADILNIKRDLHKDPRLASILCYHHVLLCVMC